MGGKKKIFSVASEFWMFNLIISQQHSIMAKNVDISFRKCTTSLTKLLKVHMLWYSYVYFFCFALEQHKKAEEKSQI